MSKPKKIINDASSSVGEFIEGLLLQYPNKLVKLQNQNVVFPTDRYLDRVQLLSGGGSGHEPSHAGWCGRGMLSAAVCGGIFASPPVNSILAALRASNTPQGTLCIVKNYTGDRLNFGMAIEKANQEGMNVQMVVVADDVALPRTKGITGARGVAGTVLVHKVAGAAAVAGKDLDQVAATARAVCANMGTLGVALDAVTVPGAQEVNDRLDENTIEIGLGIHGEAGMRQSKPLSADEIAQEMVSKIHEYGRTALDGDTFVPMFSRGDEVVVLVNNLGGTSNFEMSILARSCIRLLEGPTYGVKATRVLVGSYMTSFNMHGASLTVLNVTEHPKWLIYLDAETTAPSWASVDVWSLGDGRPSALELREVATEAQGSLKMNMPPLALTGFPEAAKGMLERAVAALAQAEPLLTKYDTIVGDGDCGITMLRGAEEVQKGLAGGDVSVSHPVALLSSLADVVSASMGGTSGILLELMFRKMSSYLSRVNTIGSKEICDSVQSGVDAICLYGGAQAGSRTMLDALIPFVQTLIQTGDLKRAATKARAGADATASLETASAGRSNYVNAETLQGTPDPGAIAVAIVIEALSS